MCGIVGMLNKDRSSVDKNLLRSFTDRLKHRGPDGSGVYINGHIGIGHRRLSIIDLETGAQPMSNEDKTVWIVHNGEIYNFLELRSSLMKDGYKFSTHSDTEVILHAYEEWGVDCLSRLRGMFAFGIWDTRKRRFFLARDRIGIKPLCYYIKGNVFAFASEIQAFWELPEFDSKIEPQAIDFYLHYQYIPAPYSIYKHVRKLQPAHYMAIHQDGTIDGPHRYWELRFNPDRSLTESEWVERLDNALQEAVRSHLISDVPFGAFLSGGVDSSSIVAYMSRILKTPVRTFTIGYEDADYDERPYAAQVARVLATIHTDELIQPDALGILPILVRHYGEPFGDSSAVCTYYVARACREHVKMVLSGDGGDETHAGYEYFAKMMLHFPVARNKFEKMRRIAGQALQRLGLRLPLPPPAKVWYDRAPFFDDIQRKRLWRHDFQNLANYTREWNDLIFKKVEEYDILSQCLYVDINNYLVNDNLCKVDIATMANGLEVRVPLLDHKLLETVTAIPSELMVKIKHGTDLFNYDHTRAIGKNLLRRGTERFFPPYFYDRRKLGFSMPISSWLAGTLHDEARSKILDRKAGLGDWFDIEYVRGLLDEHRIHRNHGNRLWLLLFLAEWRMTCPN